MITIRQASASDAAAISTLMMPVAHDQIAIDFPPEGKEALLGGMTPEAVAGYIERGYRYHLACDNGQLVGIISMRGYSHLYHLFVTREQQSHGIGRRLWEHARDISLSEIRLCEFTVYSSKIAEAFYHRLGFSRSGDPKLKNGVTAIPMRLKLEQKNKI